MLTPYLTESLCTVYGPPAQARDAGGGLTTTWPVVRAAGVRCSVNTSAAAREMWGQRGISVTASIGFLGTGVVYRGDKVVVGGDTFHVEAINETEAFGSIQATTVAGCTQVV